MKSRQFAKCKCGVICAVRGLSPANVVVRTGVTLCELASGQCWRDAVAVSNLVVAGALNGDGHDISSLRRLLMTLVYTTTHTMQAQTQTFSNYFLGFAKFTIDST